ncbi:MAG TPA: hypothetical protein VK666_27405, partial [Chryseolinea sp.]|nr:hypothetical protein [Chryseolinea sp.]
THDKNGIIKPEVAAKLKNIEQGAATSVWCATSRELNDIGGVYCEDADVADLDEGKIEHNYDEPTSLRGVKPYSVDAESAVKLWALSEKMISMSFQVK